MSITDVHAHAVAYGLHALVLYWTTAVLFSPLGSIGTAWLGASAFGGLTELYQLFRPPRTAKLKDLVADMVGAGVALLGVLLVRRTLAALRSAPGRAGNQGEAFADLTGDSQNPRLELLFLGIGGALVAVLAVWLYAYGASKPPEGPGARSLNVMSGTPLPPES